MEIEFVKSYIMSSADSLRIHLIFLNRISSNMKVGEIKQWIVPLIAYIIMRMLLY